MSLQRIYLTLLSIFVAVADPHFAVAQKPFGSRAAEVADIELSLQFGFSGKWKLGHVCPVRVEIIGLDSQTSESQASEPLTVELQTLDGDGVTVSYERQLTASQFTRLETGANSVWIPIRIGRQQAAVTLRVLGAADRLIAERRFEAEVSRRPPIDATFRCRGRINPRCRNGQFRESRGHCDDIYYRNNQSCRRFARFLPLLCLLRSGGTTHE